MKYRKLHPWKYQLVEKFSIELNFAPQKEIFTEFVRFTSYSTMNLNAGRLTLAKYYAWDGASGPCPDTPHIMKGALVHDALYQCIRLGLLERQPYRKLADETLRHLCLSNGMNKIWAQIVYWGVRLFAARGTHLQPEPPPLEVT